MTGSTEAALHNFALIRPILEDLQIKVSFLVDNKFKNVIFQLTPKKISNMMAGRKEDISDVLYHLYIGTVK